MAVVAVAALERFERAHALHGHGSAAVHPQAPLRDVDVVRAPAGDHAGAELLHAEPSGAAEIFCWHDAVDGVGDLRS